MSKISPCPNCGNKEDFSLNCCAMHGPDLFEARVQCLDCDLSTGVACPFETREEATTAAIEIWNQAVHRMVSSGCTALRARVARLEEAMRNCIDCANGRESEWGDRAQDAFDFLYSVLEEK